MFSKRIVTPIHSFDNFITKTCYCGSAVFDLFNIDLKKNQKVNIDTDFITSINTGLPATSSSASFILALSEEIGKALNRRFS